MGCLRRLGRPRRLLHLAALRRTAVLRPGRVLTGHDQSVVRDGVGQTYVATYQVSANPNPVAVVPPAMTVSVDGSILDTVSHPLIGILHPTFAEMAWTTHSVPFTATAATTTLEFASTDGPSSEWGIALDGVSVFPDLIAPPPPAPATDFSWGAPDPFTLTVDPGHTADSGVQSESDGAGVITISACDRPRQPGRHGLAEFPSARRARRPDPRQRQRRRRARASSRRP